MNKTIFTKKVVSSISVPTPFMLVSAERVKNNYQNLHALLPAVKIFYAVKCNPEQDILVSLHEAGSSFEIASIGELRRLEKIGVDPRQVIFSNPVKIPAHIEEAYRKGVRAFAFDNELEVDKLAKYAPGSDVHLRIAVSNHGSLINLASKFGALKSQSDELMILARDRGLVPAGITFHVGSQSENPELWGKAIQVAGDIISDLRQKGIEVPILNIGGGFPVPYGNKIPSLHGIIADINGSLEKLPNKVDVWCEPGRLLVADAAVIVATVIGRSMRLGKEWLYLDVGRFQAFVELFESEDIEYPVSLLKDSKSATKRFTITGPSCDSYDTIMHDVSLPSDIQIGDKVCFSMVGAYTHVYGAPFNDFPVPQVVFL